MVTFWELEKEFPHFCFAEALEIWYHCGIVIFNLHNMGLLPLVQLLGLAPASASASYFGPASPIVSLLLVTISGLMAPLLAIKASIALAQLLLFFRAELLEFCGIYVHQDHLIVGPLAGWHVILEL
jgi:hypothetical protein